MSSLLDIWNMAISHLGTGKSIAGVDEKSEERRVCSLFYDTARDTVFEDFRWGFARTFITLGLVEENPNSQWLYSYRYPNDCLDARSILSNSIPDTEKTIISFIMSNDTSGRLIYSNKTDAILEFTKRITDLNLYSASFRIALSYKLAMYLIPRLSKGDPLKIKASMVAFYLAEIDKARVNAANEEKLQKRKDTPLIVSRR